MKKIFGKAAGKGANLAGKGLQDAKKNKGNKLSEADQGLFDTRTPLQKNIDKRAYEMSILDLDGNFSKKQWAVGAGAAATGAGYLGLGHQGKQGKNKKKDDTLKFLGY